MTPDANVRFQRPAPPRAADPLDGVLVVDKPAGPTSHDMVDRVRRLFGIRKVGHGGTLDPLATGVLVLLLGRATKLSSQFLGSDKTYEGTLRLGVATDSHDAAGAVISEKDCHGITRAQLEASMTTFLGDILQVPPMVSAIKFEGVPLYKRARKGQEVERQPRLIHIYEFTLTRFELPEADFVLRCTKGTYVRKIASDIGDQLGCGAHLSRLRRTRSGNLGIEDSITDDELARLSRDDLTRRLLPLARFAGAGEYKRD
ncbi:MAG: tRNA pseudouridine(55) synthase TruB [Lentisphaerae bacterium]|nr:tRNA pseudouridine(55) synthase TruB [Lentisphaerota bacterium]